MDRIAETFNALKRQGRKGLVGYLTAGDPNLKRSEENIRIALDNGVDVLELGVPFSDPTADGPEIQAAALRALKAGMTVRKALDLVRRLRRDYDTPIILFGYANPFYRYGFRQIARDAKQAGADGFLVVDLPLEEAGEFRTHLDDQELAFIPLAAPTTPPARIRKLVRNARGFLYYIMVTGVTGTREKLAVNLSRRVRTLRGCTRLPIAVGFGVSRGAQARLAGRGADAVVVGSALVKAAREGRLKALVRELRKALD